MKGYVHLLFMLHQNGELLACNSCKNRYKIVKLQHSFNSFFSLYIHTKVVGLSLKFILILTFSNFCCVCSEIANVNVSKKTDGKHYSA